MIHLRLYGLYCAWFFVALTSAVRAPAAPLTAADYLINVWSSENGLPQNSVNCLAQTPDGYLWAGTRSGGLARFDGIRFVTFNPQTTPALKDVEFETLSVDSLGTMWITAGNESVAAMTEGRFRLVRGRNATPRWHPLQLAAEDANSAYLAAYESAIYRVPRNGAVNDVKRVKLAPAPPPQPQGPPPPPGKFFQRRDGDIWYLTSSGEIASLKLANNGESSTRVFHLDSPAVAMTKDYEDNIWVSSTNRLGVMSHDGFIDHTPANGPACNRIRKIIADRDDSIWVWEDHRLRKMQAGHWT